MASTADRLSSTKSVPQSSPQKIPGYLSATFFAALFFLCSADLFFAVRIHNLNFRFGQLLLLGAALVSFYGLIRDRLEGRKEDGGRWDVLKNWIPFFVVYGLAALFSQSPSHTLIKWVWALFNIGGAMMVCLNFQWNGRVEKGLYYGMVAIAGVVWAQFTAIYWFWDSLSISSPIPGQASLLWLRGIFWGYAQPSGQYNDTVIYRPHAFFYEPSYAGCALAFAFPLCLAMGLRGKNSFYASVVIPAMVLDAAWMTSSRSAMLGTSLSIGIMVAVGLFKKQIGLVKSLGKTVAMAALLAGLLAFSSGTRAYMNFVLGPLGPKAVITRLPDSGSSEGWRLENVLNSLKLWKQHPLLGMGAIPSPSAGSVVPWGMGQSSESMWLEVGVESGLLGFLAFLFAVFKTAYDPAKESKITGIAIPVAAGLAAHFIVSMNFTSTFPRLDYWLLFFLAVRLWAREGPSSKNA